MFKKNFMVKRFLFTFASIFFLIQTSSLRAGSWIEQNIDLTINTRFDDALNLVREQITGNPQDFEAWFYLAATLNSKMTHFENHDDEAEFTAAIDTCIRILETVIDDTVGVSRPARARRAFYLGSAYGYLAYFQGRSGQYLGAFSNGITSNNLLHEAIELDSTLYDAYLGIGVFKYWRYAKLRFISWLPFIPDERDEGIQMIKKTIRSGGLSQYMAMHQLIYILADYERPEESLIYAEQITKKYPESQFMWWAASRAFDRSNHFDQAVNAYKYLDNLLAQDKNPNPNHIVKCHLKLAAVYERMADYRACYDTCNDLLAMIGELDLDDPDEKKDEARDLMETCRDQLQTLSE